MCTVGIAKEGRAGREQNLISLFSIETSFVWRRPTARVQNRSWTVTVWSLNLIMISLFTAFPNDHLLTFYFFIYFFTLHFTASASKYFGISF